MPTYTIKKDDLVATLHNIGVLLYAVEEVLIKAEQELPAIGDVKKALDVLRTDLENTNFPGPVVFDAPEPVNTMLVGEPTQRLRKNVCNP